VTAGTIILATGVSIASWCKVDISRLICSVLVLRGEPWRLLTATLPHANFFHLIFNVAWIWVFGAMIEDAFGHFITLGIFLLLAAGSSAAEFAFLDGGIGLSGVGYGLFGILLILSKRDRRFADAMDRNTALLFIGWFFLCIVLTVTRVWSIGNVAHGAGLVLGLGLGWAMAAGIRPVSLFQRISALVGTVLLTLVFIALALVWRPYVNFSPNAAAQEAYAGYQALTENRNEDAVRWMVDATRMQPREEAYWNNLAIAYARVGQSPKALAAFARSEQLRAQQPQNKNAPQTR
jgi:membrane associated rhomboid family serine protease